MRVIASLNRDPTSPWRTLRRAFPLAVAVVIAAAAAAAASPAGGPASPTIRLFTENLYVGFDVRTLMSLNRPSLAQLTAAATAAYQSVQASRPPARMAAVAAEIATARPDLVGLQEAATYQSASHGSYDFTALLRRYLSRRGLRYSVVANATNVDVTVPIDGGDFVRFTDHDVLLARTARGAKKLTITHRQSGHYADVTVVNGPLAPVVFSRGWTSADVELGKRSFNIVETHLEAFDNAQQAAQAHELIAGPAASRLPTIVMGDLNSNASSGPDQTEAYPDLIAAGFKDLWSLARPADPGYTCCQAADLRNTASRLDKRIDVVLGRGAFTPVAAAVVGDNAAVRARIGVWASDHAGVTMTLRLR